MLRMGKIIVCDSAYARNLHSLAMFSICAVATNLSSRVTKLNQAR